MAKAQNISANTGRTIEKKKKKQQEFIKNAAKKAADVEKRVSSKSPNKKAASSNPRSRSAGTKAKESSNPRAKRSSYNYKPVTVKRPSKSEPFKASDISGSTGRGVSKQARKQTKSSYTTAAKHKAQAKQKESDIKAGKFNVPNRLSKDEQMMLSKEGRNAVNYYKNEWEKAKARGDKAGMQKAHEEAEKVRLKNPATVRTYTPDGPTRDQATAIALQQYAQAMAVGDKEGMEQARNLAAYAMINLPKENKEQSYMTGAYSGGTWGDRVLDPSESDILKNQKKNLLKSEGAAFASAVPEAAGGYIETIMNAPSSVKGGPSQLVVRDPNVDKRTASQFELRGQSRYTEEDARAKADHYQAQAEYLKQVARATTPLPGVAGDWAVNLTSAAGGMGIDFAANALIPGSGLVSMGARTFGSSVQQAKDFQKVNGTDKDPYADAKAYLYGAAIAGTEIASEKMFGGPWSKIYGKGFLDAAAKGAKPTIGKSILKGMLEEGTEEVAADVAQWQAPRIYGGETETLPEMLKGAAYDFTLGAALGGLGGAVTAPAEVRNKKVNGLRERMLNAGASDAAISQALSEMSYKEAETMLDASDSTFAEWVQERVTGDGTGAEALRKATREKLGTDGTEEPVQLKFREKQSLLDSLGKRLTQLGVAGSEITPITTGFAKNNYDNELVRVSQMDDKEFATWASSQGLNSPEIENQSLSGASEEQGSEQTFEGEQEESQKMSSGKAWKALRKRLRESGINNEEMLRMIRSRMAPEEYEEALNLRKNDFLEWRDRITSPDYKPAPREEAPKPTENISAEEEQAAPEAGAVTIEPEVQPGEKAPASSELTPEALRKQSEMLEKMRSNTLVQEMAEKSGKPVSEMNEIDIMGALLGENGQRTLVNNFNPKLHTPAWYVQEMFRAYNAGFAGVRYEAFNYTINKKLATLMYQAGRGDAQVSMREQKAEAKSRPAFRRKDAGLQNQDDPWIQKNVKGLTRNQLDRLGKALGVQIYFADAVGGLDAKTKASIANGSYSKGIVLIAKDSDAPVPFVIGHELTHRMKDVSPEAYEGLLKYYMSLQRAEEDIAVITDLYARAGIPRTQEELTEEAVADFVGKMIHDEDMLQRFAERADRSIVQKFLDALKAIARKLSGRELKDVELAIHTIETALDKSVKANRKLAKKNAVATDVKTKSGVNYSLRMFEDGTRFVDVEVDQERFDGLGKREMGALATKVIKEKFAGKVIGIDNKVFVNGRTAGEYGFPMKRLDDDTHEAKMRASTELDNLLDAGRNFRTEPDGKDGHVHPDMVDDFRYFDTIFKVGGEYYEGVINIMPIKSGLLLKDITKIKNITEHISSSYGETPKSTLLRDASMDIISDRAGRSQEKTAKAKDQEFAKSTQDPEVQESRAVVDSETGDKLSLKSLDHDLAEGKMFDDLISAGIMTKKQTEMLRGNINELVKKMMNAANIVDLNEEYTKEDRPYSPLKPNSDPLYKISLDFTTMCRKRLLTQSIVERIQVAEGKAMTPDRQLKVRELLQEYRKLDMAVQVACGMCYVEAARYKSPKPINAWLKNPTPVVTKYFAKKDKGFNKQLQERAAKKKAELGYPEDTPKKDMSNEHKNILNKFLDDERKKYKLTNQQKEVLAKIKAMSPETFLTEKNLTQLLIEEPVIYDIFISNVRAATRSKAVQGPVPYYYGDSNENLKDSAIQNMNAENGLRFSSWSDWQVQHMLDMMVAIIDLSVRGVKMHGYTKFPEFVRIFGNTGMQFNLSGVLGTVEPIINEDGTYSQDNFDSVEGVDIKEAIKTRDKFPETAGIQCIGVSDAQIKALLQTDWIDYIIPYHSSGLNKALRKIAKIEEWKDYTKVQEAHPIDKDAEPGEGDDVENWHKEPVFSEFMVWEGENGLDCMRKSARKYVEMCEKRGMVPKFNDIRLWSEQQAEDNYWKLLIDRKMINQESKELIIQQAVKPDFDFEEMNNAIDREVKEYDPRRETEAFKYVVENASKGGLRFAKDVREQAAKITSTFVENVVSEPKEQKFSLKGSAKTTAQFTEDKYFARQIDKWDELSAGTRIKVGNILSGSALNQVGLPAGRMFFDVGKIRTSMNTHKDLTPTILKRIPEILNDPIVISEYKGPKEDVKNTISVYGNLFIKGKPVVIGVVMHRDINGVNIVSTVRTIHPRGNFQKQLTDDRILFLNEDKKKTREWFHVCGIPNVPLNGTKYGLIRSITFEEEKDKSKKSLKQRDEEYLQAVRDGDMEKAQRMVDEAAKEAGFPVEVYHGTKRFGFTEPDTGKSDDRISFFVTEDPETASTYSGTVFSRVIDQSFVDYEINESDDYGPKNNYGMYRLYMRPGKLLEVDAKGARWNRIQWDDSYMSTREIARAAKDAGYDGVHFINVVDSGGMMDVEADAADVYALFYPERDLKSADPITIANDGSVIPLSERFNPDNPDIRWSIKGGRAYEELLAEYGAIAPGERPSRNIQVPKQTSDEEKVSQTIRTVMEARRTPEELLPTIEQMIESGEFSYESFGDKAAVTRAQKKILNGGPNGLEDAYTEWYNQVQGGIVSKELTAMGWVLYSTYVKEKNYDRACKILIQIDKHQRNAAQALQATRILKTFPPEIRLAIDRARGKVDPDNEDLIDEDEYWNDEDFWGDKEGVEDDEEEGDGETRPKPSRPRKPRRKPMTPDEVDDIEQKNAEYRAEHSKATFLDKWNAWRYMAMLANFRTHIRNIVGNAGFFPVVMSKNLVATAAEIAVYHTIGKRGKTKMERTKGIYNPKAFAFAWKDYAPMRATILGELKYEGQDLEMEVVFPGLFGKPFEAVRRFNSNMLNWEDSWFSKPHYANALAQYMAANGITAEMMETGVGIIERGPNNGKPFTQEMANKARAYAVKEAQKGTYRDLNAFSEMFMRLGTPRSKNPSKAEKVKDLLINGVLPFKKTPANILCRAVEYSPIGFGLGLKKLLFDVPYTHKIADLRSQGKKKKNGEDYPDVEVVTVAEALDALASGFSGSALFALGMMLAEMGVLIAKTDDGDDKQKYFNRLLGKQQWAIEVDDTSYTIDWLAPEIIPMFMGAQLFRETADDASSFKTATRMLEALSGVMDPVLELSCLSGVQQAMDDAASFADGDLNTMVAFIGSMGLSYFTQAIPTLAGQLERVSQEDRMTTYTTDSPDELLTKDMQYLLGKISAKVPGWDYRQIPYIDAWGQTERETSTFKRVVANMFNPAYVKKIDTRAVNKELQRLYDSTNTGYVLPSPGWNNYSYTDENGKSHDVYLTADEYVTYARAKGRTQFDLVSKFIDSKAYKGMTDADRVSVINEIYNYAEYTASEEYIHDFKGSPKGYVVGDYINFTNQYGNKLDIVDYIVIDKSTKNTSGLYDPKKDKNAYAEKNTSSAAKAQALYNSGVKIPTDPEERDAFLEMFGVQSKEVRGWNQAQTDEFMEKQRKKGYITKEERDKL